jgi:HNH endonuclease
MKTPCIEHPNKPERNGYVRIRHKGKKDYAHRFAYRWFNGPLIRGLEIDHICKNKRCWNADHLEQVLPIVNKLRSNCVSGINARKTHCKHGHEFTKANTYLTKENGRIRRHCLQCKSDRC